MLLFLVYVVHVHTSDRLQKLLVTPFSILFYTSRRSMMDPDFVFMGVAGMRSTNRDLQCHFIRFSVFLVAIGATTTAGQAQTAEQVLKLYNPVHSVVYDTPDPADFAKCKLEVERGEGKAGFVVYGPSGEVLRRFTDTDGDSKADQFRYYHMGLEVYRDIDTDKNETSDQHRWMNWGGTRWGIDRNEDRKIDEWRVLSAQEAARIAVEAMIARDAQTLASVMLTEEDIRSIQPNAEVGKRLRESVSNLPQQLQTALSKSKTISAGTKWVRFDPAAPNLVPKEDGKAGVDLTVYQNAMAIVENGPNHELVAVGEMIKVGEVWKLVQVPNPLSDDNAQIQLGGILMQPMVDPGRNDFVDPSMNEALNELLTELQKLDESVGQNTADPKKLATYHQRRADIMEKIVAAVPAGQDQEQWAQQLVDSLTLATQTGQYDAGLQRLSQLKKTFKGSKTLQAYISYRTLLAEYAVRLNLEDAKQRQEAQTWWLAQLEEYAETYPESPDAADAEVQLGISYELMGRVDDAKRWYTTAARNHGDTPFGVRANGALRRLTMAGKPIALQGTNFTGQPLSLKQYEGKVTLVVFWATWADPYTADLPTLTAVYKKYQRSGFEIVGVNLDMNVEDIRAYLKKNGNYWQNIHEKEGTDGPLGRSFGIVSVPTMFIVDKSGRVAGTVTAANLETIVDRMLSGKPVAGATRPGATTNQ